MGGYYWSEDTQTWQLGLYSSCNIFSSRYFLSNPDQCDGIIFIPQRVSPVKFKILKTLRFTDCRMECLLMVQHLLNFDESGETYVVGIWLPRHKYKHCHRWPEDCRNTKIVRNFHQLVIGWGIWCSIWLGIGFYLSAILCKYSCQTPCPLRMINSFPFILRFICFYNSRLQ